jgi:hypothetical protein
MIDSSALCGKYPSNALFIVRLRSLNDLLSKIVWFFLVATLWVLGVLISPAYPWGSKGHEIVASIAETHLTDTAPERIKELLPQGTTLAEHRPGPTRLAGRFPIWIRTT